MDGLCLVLAGAMCIDTPDPRHRPLVMDATRRKSSGIRNNALPAHGFRGADAGDGSEDEDELLYEVVLEHGDVAGGQAGAVPELEDEEEMLDERMRGDGDAAGGQGGQPGGVPFVDPELYAAALRREVDRPVEDEDRPPLAPAVEPPLEVAPTPVPQVTPGFILCSKADLDTTLRALQGTDALPDALAQAQAGDIAAAAAFSYVDVKGVLNRTIASVEACLSTARGADGRQGQAARAAAGGPSTGFASDDVLAALDVPMCAAAIFPLTRAWDAFHQARRALDAAVQAAVQAAAAAADAGPGVPADLNYAGMGLAVCTWGEGAAAQAAIVRAAPVVFDELERAMNAEEASAEQAGGGDAGARWEVAARHIATHMQAAHAQLRCLVTNGVLHEASELWSHLGSRAGTARAFRAVDRRAPGDDPNAGAVLDLGRAGDAFGDKATLFAADLIKHKRKHLLFLLRKSGARPTLEVRDETDGEPGEEGGRRSTFLPPSAFFPPPRPRPPFFFTMSCVLSHVSHALTLPLPSRPSAPQPPSTTAHINCARTLAEVFKDEHRRAGGGDLHTAVRVYYESVDGEPLATEEDVDARVANLRLWEEVEAARRVNFRGMTADDKLAVIELDLTRYARSGALMGGLIARADQEEVRLYTAFIDRVATSQVADGVVIPAGVEPARAAKYFTGPAHLRALAHLRTYFSLPGGACTFAPTCIASGIPGEPAPSGNVAMAKRVGARGGLAVLALVRGMSFQSRSSPPILEGRWRRARAYVDSAAHVCPDDTPHAKNLNGDLRFNLARDLHSHAVPGWPGDRAGLVIAGAQHLGGSAVAAVAAHFNGDHTGRTRSQGVGYLVIAPQVFPALLHWLLPRAEVHPSFDHIFYPLGPAHPGYADAPHGLPVGLRWGSLILVRMVPNPEGEHAPLLYQLCKVTDINTGVAPAWREDVYLHPGDMRVASSTGAVDILLRPEVYHPPRDDGGSPPPVCVRRVVRQNPLVLDPPPGQPPFEIVLGYPPHLRQRPGRRAPVGVDDIPAVRRVVEPPQPGDAPALALAPLLAAHLAQADGRGAQADLGYGGGRRGGGGAGRAPGRGRGRGGRRGGGGAGAGRARGGGGGGLSEVR